MTLKNLRSLLFVPTLQDRFVSSALQSSADVIILDLEDSIAPNEKTRARERLRHASRLLAAGGRRVFVRINSYPRTEMELDVAEAADASIEGLLIPKVDTSAQIADVASLAIAARAEGASPQKIIALVESPLGIVNVNAIAAIPQVAGLAFGSEDYAISMSSEPTEEAMLFPAQQMALAARARDIAALGIPGSIAIVDDMDRFSRIVRMAKLVGMTGILCIHPKQVAAANAVFTPSSQEIEEATEVKDIYERSLAQGMGATRHRGKMIDIPHYQKALSILERAKLHSKAS